MPTKITSLFASKIVPKAGGESRVAPGSDGVIIFCHVSAYTGKSNLVDNNVLKRVLKKVH